MYSFDIRLTSESGEKLKRQPNIHFTNGHARGNVIKISPHKRKQKLMGIGGAFTESTAFVLAHLEKDHCDRVMNHLFSDQGANFSLARTPIGSCDFCVKGKYSYADNVDKTLCDFTIKTDHDGFSPDIYNGIKDSDFDLLPMIKQAQAIKNNQHDKDLRILASAWTAPFWMKNNKDWFGGELAADYKSTYARYLIKYIDAYHREGVKIWGITPVNEPLGNDAQWESMHFTPETQNIFIRDFLGPALCASKYSKTRLFMYDHSREQLEYWADALYRDKECAQYVHGAAIHWYESTFRVYEESLDKVHFKYPDKEIIHTEGCIDNLGNDAPEGVLDPDNYKENNWFDNDAFWWNDNATDWAYSATWPGVVAEDHPMYTPVHRYARNIIVSLNHWVSGWIDWNLILDQRGGPNHVGNYCGAPIMVDIDNANVYYTPVYFILAQLSRSIRPGDVVVQTDHHLEKALRDRIYATSTINSKNYLSIQLLNTEKLNIKCAIQIGQQHAEISLLANSLLTISIQL